MTDTTTNWQTMSAGRELDRIVAERLGWRFVPTTTSDFHVYSPHGLIWATDKNYRANIGDVPPCFSTSTDAALTLLPLLGGEWFTWSLSPTRIDLTYRCEINKVMRRWEGIADTPALAICRAWLSWKDGEYD